MDVLEIGVLLESLKRRLSAESFVLKPWVLHTLFLAYAANCILFYQDRMDLDVCQFLNSCLLFRNDFFIVHGRAFIQVPPQLPPWLAAQLGMPVKTVVMAYSLGYWLYHYVMTLLLYYGFRRRDLATLQVFVIFIHLVHNNFYMYADGMHIVPYALCMVAALQVPTGSPFGRILAGLGAVCFAVAAASSHPFGLPLCGALGIHVFMSAEQRRRLLPALLATGAALAVYFVWNRARMDAYDRAAMEMFGLSTLRQNGLHFARYFVCAHFFAIVCAATLGVLGLRNAARRGHYWLAALCVLGYALMIAAYLPKFTHLYYWHCLIPMYAVLAAPFFDVHGSTPGTRRCSRLMFGAAMVWMVAGSALDLSALRVRDAFHTHLLDALPKDKDGSRFYVLEDRQLSHDYLSSFLPQYLSEETCIRSACTDPAAFSVLMARSRFEKGNWMFQPRGGASPRYLPRLPLKKEMFVPAIVPAPRADIVQLAAGVSIGYPERPTSLRLIDGWLCNYQRPPKIVGTLPVTVTNRGDRPFPAGDTGGQAVTFGYYWHRDGKILFENQRAECLPVDVTSTLHRVLNIQWFGIPADAKLTVDLFLKGRPLLHPEIYDGLEPSDQYFAREAGVGNCLELLDGCYVPEKSGVWLAKQARFSFCRDLRSCSFSLMPPPNVNAGNPVDVEVRCEATGAVFTHHFTDRRPFVVTVPDPRKGQTVLVTASRDYCPARETESQDTRSLAMKLHAVTSVARQGADIKRGE